MNALLDTPPASVTVTVKLPVPVAAGVAVTTPDPLTVTQLELSLNVQPGFGQLKVNGMVVALLLISRIGAELDVVGPVIVGARSPDQIAQNVPAHTWTLSEAERDEVTELAAG